jgi:hypothetical protein
MTGCGRCGRYFTALIKYILPYRDLLTNQSPFKAVLKAFVAEERALDDLRA